MQGERGWKHVFGIDTLGVVDTEIGVLTLSYSVLREHQMRVGRYASPGQTG